MTYFVCIVTAVISPLKYYRSHRNGSPFPCYAAVGQGVLLSRGLIPQSPEAPGAGGGFRVPTVCESGLGHLLCPTQPLPFKLGLRISEFPTE